MKVLAIDPGEKVGWCRFDADTKGRVKNLKYGISGLKEMALRIAKVYDSYDVVVMENWRLSAVHAKSMYGSELPTVQFIGMVQLLAWQNPKVKLVKQSPSVMSTAKRTMKKLKPSWYEIVSEPIAHDAGHHQSAILHGWHWVWCDLISTMEAQ